MAEIADKVVHAFLSAHDCKTELSLVEIFPEINIKILVASFLSQLQGLSELLFALFVVFLRARNHSQFQESFHLSLVVLHLLRQFQVLFHKDLHLVFVFRKVFSADLTNVSDCQ